MHVLPCKARSEALRAYLLVACAAAFAIDIVVLYAGLIFDVPDSVFGSTPFRVAAIVAIAVTTLVVRLRCGMAFRCALGNGDAFARDEHDRAIVVKTRCPERRLVCFYARLSGRRAVVY